MNAVDVDPRAVMGAKNNADWYVMMFDVHGLRSERSAKTFLALDDPPPYHSHMTLLSPELGPDTTTLIATRAKRKGFGIKDSFCRLDLATLKLTQFFSASWIWRDQPHQSDTEGWVRVDNTTDLAAWESAWKDGGSPSDHLQFPAAILDRPDVAIFGRRTGADFDAGAIGNVSSDCVGMSNVFGMDAMAAAASLVADFGVGLPVVGYERGDDLAAAISIGFETVGQLRVCESTTGFTESS